MNQTAKEFLFILGLGLFVALAPSRLPKETPEPPLAAPCGCGQSCPADCPCGCRPK